MKANGEYYLKCLANRVAGYQNMRKRFTIDWKYARIEEDKNSPIQDMEAVFNAISNNTNRSPRGNTADIHTFVSQTVPQETTDPVSRPNITGSGLSP